MSQALRREDPRKGLFLSAGLLVLVVVFMAIMRTVLRDAYLAEYFKPAEFTVQTQWDVMLLFSLLLLGGAVLWLVMIKRYFFSPELQAGT